MAAKKKISLEEMADRLQKRVKKLYTWGGEGRSPTMAHRLQLAGVDTAGAEWKEQDIPIWNHKTYVEDPILCDGDGPIAKYRKWFSQFYA